MRRSSRIRSTTRDAGLRAAAIVVALTAAGCGGSGPFVPGEECPDVAQAGLVPALSCAVTHGAVEGRVVDAETGDPIVGAVVATSPSTNTALTGADGGFEIEGIPLEESSASATVAVTATKSGYDPDSRTIEVRPRARVELALVARSARSPVGGLEIGVLVRHRGAPFEGATVDLIDLAGNVEESATSDANGFALFADRTPGTYTVRATATIAGRPFGATEGVRLEPGKAAFVGLDLRQVF